MYTQVNHQGRLYGRPTPRSSKMSVSITLVAALLTLAAVLLLLDLSSPAANLRYVLVVDSGSSGTRMYAYRWSPAASPAALPTVAPVPASAAPHKLPASNVKGMYNRVETRPGLDAFAANPAGLRKEALGPLLDWAGAVVHSGAAGHAPLYLFATGGVRRMAVAQQAELMQGVRRVLGSSGFRFEPDWARVISGVQEAVYGWVALNYLHGKLTPPGAQGMHSKPHLKHGSNSSGGGGGGRSKRADAAAAAIVDVAARTLGALDMGGSTLEVSQAVASTPAGQVPHHLPTQLVNSMVNITLAGVTHWLHTHTYHQYGLNEAYDSAVSLLLRKQQAVQWEGQRRQQRIRNGTVISPDEAAASAGADTARPAALAQQPQQQLWNDSSSQQQPDLRAAGATPQPGAALGPSALAPIGSQAQPATQSVAPSTTSGQPLPASSAAGHQGQLAEQIAAVNAANQQGSADAAISSMSSTTSELEEAASSSIQRHSSSSHGAHRSRLSPINQSDQSYEAAAMASTPIAIGNAVTSANIHTDSSSSAVDSHLPREPTAGLRFRQLSGSGRSLHALGGQLMPEGLSYQPFTAQAAPQAADGVPAAVGGPQLQSSSVQPEPEQQQGVQQLLLSASKRHDLASSAAVRRRHHRQQRRQLLQQLLLEGFLPAMADAAAAAAAAYQHGHHSSRSSSVLAGLIQDSSQPQLQRMQPAWELAASAPDWAAVGSGTGEAAPGLLVGALRRLQRLVPRDRGSTTGKQPSSGAVAAGPAPPNSSQQPSLTHDGSGYHVPMAPAPAPAEGASGGSSGGSSIVGDGDLVVVRHPCLHHGFDQPYERIKHEGRPPTPAKVRLQGAFHWARCQALVRAVVNASRSCPPAPHHGACRLGASYPSFSGNFVALTGFFVVSKFLGVPPTAALDELEAAAQQLCERRWSWMESNLAGHINKERYCAWGPYVVLLLREGLQLGEGQAVMGPGDVGWPLGAALLEASKLADMGPKQQQQQQRKAAAAWAPGSSYGSPHKVTLVDVLQASRRAWQWAGLMLCVVAACYVLLTCLPRGWGVVSSGSGSWGSSGSLGSKSSSERLHQVEAFSSSVGHLSQQLGGGPMVGKRSPSRLMLRQGIV